MDAEVSDYLYQYVGYMINQRAETGAFPVIVSEEEGYKLLGNLPNNVSVYFNENSMLVMELGDDGRRFMLQIYGDQVEEYSEVALRVAKAFDKDARFALRTDSLMGNQIDFKAAGMCLSIMIKAEQMPVSSGVNGAKLPGTALWVTDGPEGWV